MAQVGFFFFLFGFVFFPPDGALRDISKCTVVTQTGALPGHTQNSLIHKTILFPTQFGNGRTH